MHRARAVGPAAPTRQAGVGSVALRAKNLALSWDPLRVLMFTLIVINISRIHQHFPILIRLRPAFLLTGAIAAYILLNPSSAVLSRALKTWPAKVILALAVVACLSAPFGISLGRSASFIMSTYSKVIVSAFLLIAAIRNTRDLATIAWAYVISCGILSYFSFTSVRLAKLGPSLAYRMVGGQTYDPNDLGCILLIGLGLALWLFQTSSGFRKWVCVGIMIAIGLTIARSGSRGSFVGLLGVGAWLLVTLRSVPVVKRLAFVAVVAVALAIGAPPGYWDQMSTIFNPTQDYNWTTTDGRKELWKRGFQYMMDYPVFGLGIDNYPMAEGLISEKAQTAAAGTGIRWATTHNSYLQAGAEMGLPGFFLWTALVLGGVVGVRRLRHRIPAHWSRGDPEQRFLYAAPVFMPVAIVGFAVSSAFVSLAYADPVYILAGLTAGLYASLELKLRQESNGIVPLPAPGARRRQRHRTRARPAHFPIQGRGRASR